MVFYYSAFFRHAEHDITTCKTMLIACLRLVRSLINTSKHDQVLLSRYYFQVIHPFIVRTISAYM